MNDASLTQPVPSVNPSAIRSKRRLFAGLAATAATLAAVGWHARAQAHGGMHRGMRGAWGEMDPETRGRRIDAMTAWMLADVDATPEQRDRIAAIMKGAANDLAPLRQQHRQARRQSIELMAQPTIDRARLEQLRVQQMQLGDTTSRRMLQAMIDAAEVLNPEQRVRLAQRWQRRMPPLG